ncbi:hypothetical protein [Streptomyces sp. NPDC102360]|uniref:hypothetical protein n=1 Tax=Streptomyces sp. NPDC102360 TaxID=3366160 RepID=UPI0037F78D14
MSAPENVFASLPRQRSRRERLVRRLVRALAVVLVLAGVAWGVSAVFAPQGPGDHAPMAICTTLDTSVMRADVDGDGHLDEINDPVHDGVTSVVFSDGDKADVGDARGTWAKLRGTNLDDMATRGTIGDFDGDGYVDLALFYSQDDIGDSPQEAMLVHEVHYGPLARDLTSERTGNIRIRSKTYVDGVRASDQDHDGRAELLIVQSTGDGTSAMRSGVQEDGGISVADKVSDDETDFTTAGDWPPAAHGWQDFKDCGR